jgi:hypothetical protein
MPIFRTKIYSRFALLIISFLIATLFVLPNSASAQTAYAWQPTETKILPLSSGIKSSCVDATQPDTFYYGIQEENISGIFRADLKGNTTKIREGSYFACDEQNSLLYFYNNITTLSDRSGVRYNPHTKETKPVDYVPNVFAKDGTQQVYFMAGDYCGRDCTQ